MTPKSNLFPFLVSPDLQLHACCAATYSLDINAVDLVDEISYSYFLQHSPVHEVHGHRELVLVEHPVAVDVGQVPNLAQHRHRQLRTHHDLSDLERERKG